MEYQMTRLHIPVPPPSMLEHAVGYRNQRDSRYLALWWEPCGDEVMVSDGYVTFTGHWPGYLAYVQHPRVAPAVANYNLGSSEECAAHRLLIDLKSRLAYIVSGAEGERILAAQWEHQPGTAPTVLFVEDLEALLQGWTESRQFEPSLEDVMRRMEEDHQAVESLRGWMDTQIT